LATALQSFLGNLRRYAEREPSLLVVEKQKAIEQGSPRNAYLTGLAIERATRRFVLQFSQRRIFGAFGRT
jgi:hypothetical protein